MWPEGADTTERRAAAEPTSDTAFVLRSERTRTQIAGCETVEVVDALTADQDEGEDAVADAEADG